MPVKPTEVLTRSTTTYKWRCPSCGTANKSTRPADDACPHGKCGNCHQWFYLDRTATEPPAILRSGRKRGAR